MLCVVRPVLAPCLAMNLNYRNKLFFMKALAFVPVVRIRAAVATTHTREAANLAIKQWRSPKCAELKMQHSVFRFTVFKRLLKPEPSPRRCLGNTAYNVTRKGVFSAIANCISRKV